MWTDGKATVLVREDVDALINALPEIVLLTILFGVSVSADETSSGDISKLIFIKQNAE